MIMMMVMMMVMMMMMMMIMMIQFMKPYSNVVKAHLLLVIAL